MNLLILITNEKEPPTWVTIRLYAEFSLPTRGWEGVSFKLWSCEASRWGFSWDPKPGWSLISWAQGRTMAATHSSTWRCRKLFHVYLKNKSWKKKKKKQHWASTFPSVLNYGNSRLTRSRSMVLSRHSSCAMTAWLEELVYSREATSLATCRRVLPKGSSSTPSVVSMGFL